MEEEDKKEKEEEKGMMRRRYRKGNFIYHMNLTQLLNNMKLLYISLCLLVCQKIVYCYNISFFARTTLLIKRDCTNTY